MSFKTGTHNTYFFIPGNRVTHYLTIISIPISALVSLKWEWLEDSHRNESPNALSVTVLPAPEVRLLSLPFPILFIFFLILLTPSIIAVGQWIEEDTDLTRTGAESLGEVISPKIHSLEGWPLPFHPLDFRCSCLDGPCKTLTRSVKTADV